MLFSYNKIISKIKSMRKSIIHESGEMKTASLTIEAAMVFPIFLFMIMFVISIIIFIGIQMKVQLAMYNTAMLMSKYEYAYEIAMMETDVNLKELEEASVVTQIIGQGMEIATVKGIFTAQLSYNNIEKSCIKGGIWGFHFYKSDILNDDNVIDFVVNYELKSPFDIFGIGTIPVEQRARVRCFSGDESYLNDKDDEKEYVYVTPTGRVYHTHKDCSYIKLSIKKTDYSLVGNLRNESGAKYYRCESCIKKLEPNEVLYITDYGTRYHKNKNCSKIKRGYTKMPLSEVHDRKKCSKCEKNDASGISGINNSNSIGNFKYSGYTKEEYIHSRTGSNIGNWNSECVNSGKKYNNYGICHASGNGVLWCCNTDQRTTWKRRWNFVDMYGSSA